MWTASTETLSDRRGLKYTIADDVGPLHYEQVLQLWQNAAAFRSFFNTLLAGAEFSAFRWETPPISSRTSKRLFEFVLLNSPELNVPPDSSSFAEHFRHPVADGVVAFDNLGKNATLVVPCPAERALDYAHIANFVRHAPEAQQHALWSKVGSAMQQRLSAKPVWLSTAGAGVAWLHVRLDDRPKYYHYQPYRDERG